MLMPLALGTTAQDLPTHAQVAPSAAEPMPVFPRPTDGRPEQRPPPVDAKPLPASFNVREFEAMAQALVADQRVPGLAMAIVHNLSLIHI